MPSIDNYVDKQNLQFTQQLQCRLAWHRVCHHHQTVLNIQTDDEPSDKENMKNTRKLYNMFPRDFRWCDSALQLCSASRSWSRMKKTTESKKETQFLHHFSTPHQQLSQVTSKRLSALCISALSSLCPNIQLDGRSALKDTLANNNRSTRPRKHSSNLAI